MVNGALSIAGFLGVLLSAAFVYFEVGRFATPQVPRTLFDERRELYAYAAGLFVGVPLAVVFLLLQAAVVNRAIISAIVDIALLAGGSEIAQWAFARSHYFGRSDATPFYALGFRAGAAAILVLAAISSYLSGPNLSVDGLVLVAAQSFALLAIQATGALLSIPRSSGLPGASGGPLSGLLVGSFAFALLSVGQTIGPLGGAAAALLVTAGLVPMYRRLRRAILERARPPSSPGPSEPGPRPPFGRTDA